MIGKAQRSIYDRSISIYLVTQSVVLSALILLERLRIGSVNCKSGCAEVETLWYSNLLLVGLVTGSIIAVTLEFIPNSRKVTVAKVGLLSAALLAFALMVLAKTFCTLCFAAQLTWIGIGLTSIRTGWPYWISLTLAVIGLDISYESWQLRRPSRSSAVEFEPRSFEKLPGGSPKAFVVFTDPFCPYCRQNAQAIAILACPIPILIRWKVLPQHGEGAIRVASCIEGALSVDYAKGEDLYTSICMEPSAITEAGVKAVGSHSKFSKLDIPELLNSPSEATLESLRKDGALADTLGIAIVPTLCVVNLGPGSEGLTIRKVNSVDLQQYEQLLNCSLEPLSTFFRGAGSGKR